MDKETSNATKKFASRIRKKFDVKKIILFGSRARGDNFKTSDYDFVIVSQDFDGIHFTERMSEMLRYWNEKHDLEPLCYTPKEFEEKKKQIGIVNQAVKEGITIK